MKRQANAEWQGGLQDGKGTITTQSKVLSATPYSFRSRFGDGAETNPEELVAAAHAGCYSMALSAALAGAGHPPEYVRTEAVATMEKLEAGWTVTEIQLKVRAKVPGTDGPTFTKLANDAKANCIISRLLKTQITLDATLEGVPTPA
jgi:osmotically inducible protein OsmC